MGVFSGPSKDDIEALLAARGIESKNTYVVVQPHDSILRQITRLLISNLAATIDASRIRIIAFTPKELVVINPSRQTIGELKDLADKHIQSYPLEKLAELSLDDGKITWQYLGKRETWKVPLANSGVFHFNRNNFQEIKKMLGGSTK
ncbi:hypothetical protein [Arcanobacterium hippocoleae]|uniref:Uncharacterized protein n=1 Tax=Arcanobacterium hippocoleae TaxID=149017 RepID=A0ABU1T0W8_9ACTO|nr:hypothetical protein [Arcanobacterium hippocoleae]MDR6938995.1 hypothetical protein [Arcanobacterium hippocoleae]